MHFKRYHVRLLVDHFAECFRFYRDVLSLPVRYGMEDDDYAEFRSEALHIALYRRALMAAIAGTFPLPVADTGLDRAVLVLRVDDVDATVANIVENGGRMTVPPTDRPAWGCRTAHLRNPSGTLIEINADLT